MLSTTARRATGLAPKEGIRIKADGATPTDATGGMSKRPPARRSRCPYHMMQS